MAVSAKAVYTIAEVAKICNTTPRDASRWFDSGRLRGYRIPGSNDRRVPHMQLVEFMQARHIQWPHESEVDAPHKYDDHGMMPHLSREELLTIDEALEAATIIQNGASDDERLLAEKASALLERLRSGGRRKLDILNMPGS